MFKIKGFKLVLICLLVTLSASCFSLLFVNAYSSFTKPAEPQAAAVYDFKNGAVSSYNYTEYCISNINGFKNFQTSVNDNGLTFSGRTIKLQNDLDFSGYSTRDSETGSLIRVFDGTFDGQGYTISNISFELVYNGNLNYYFFKDENNKVRQFYHGAFIHYLGIYGTVKSTKFKDTKIDQPNTHDAAFNDQDKDILAIAVVVGVNMGGTIDSCIVENVTFDTVRTETKYGYVTTFAAGMLSSYVKSYRSGNYWVLELINKSYTPTISNCIVLGSINIKAAAFRGVNFKYIYGNFTKLLNTDNYSCYNCICDAKVTTDRTGTYNSDYLNNDTGMYTSFSTAASNINNSKWHNYKENYVYTYNSIDYKIWLKAFIKDLVIVEFKCSPAEGGSISPADDIECPRQAVLDASIDGVTKGEIKLYGSQISISINDEYVLKSWELRTSGSNGYIIWANFVKAISNVTFIVTNEVVYTENGEIKESNSTYKMDIRESSAKKDITITYSTESCTFQFNDKDWASKEIIYSPIEGYELTGYFVGGTKYIENKTITVTNNTTISVEVREIGTEEPDPEPDPDATYWQLTFENADNATESASLGPYNISKTSNNTISVSLSNGECSFTFKTEGDSSNTIFKYTADFGYKIKAYTVNGTESTGASITISEDATISVVLEQKSTPTPDPEPDPDDIYWEITFLGTVNTSESPSNSEPYKINKTSNNTIKVTLSSSTCLFEFTQNGSVSKTTFIYTANSGYKITGFQIGKTLYTSSQSSITISSDTTILVATELSVQKGYIKLQFLSPTSNDYNISYYRYDTAEFVSTTITVDDKDSVEKTLNIKDGFLCPTYNGSEIKIAAFISSKVTGVRFAVDGYSANKETNLIVVSCKVFRIIDITFNQPVTKNNVSIPTEYYDSSEEEPSNRATCYCSIPDGMITIYTPTNIKVEKSVEEIETTNKKEIKYLLNNKGSYLIRGYYSDVYRFVDAGIIINGSTVKITPLVELDTSKNATINFNKPITEEGTEINSEYINAPDGTIEIEFVSSIERLEDYYRVPVEYNVNNITFAVFNNAAGGYVGYSYSSTVYIFKRSEITFEEYNVYITPIAEQKYVKLSFAQDDKYSCKKEGETEAITDFVLIDYVSTYDGITIPSGMVTYKVENEAKKITVTSKYNSSTLNVICEFVVIGYEFTTITIEPQTTEEILVTIEYKRSIVMVTFANATGCGASVSPNNTTEIEAIYDSSDNFVYYEIDWNTLTLTFAVNTAGGNVYVTYTLPSSDTKYIFNNSVEILEPNAEGKVTISPTLILKMYDVGFGEA